MSAGPEHREAPPVGEEIHIPGPSLLPIFCAFGITLAVVGTTISVIFIVVGLVIFVWSTFRWIVSTRRDIDDLPADHS